MSLPPESNIRTGRSVEAFRQALIDNFYFVLGAAPKSASPHDRYMTLAYTVRDHLMARWRKTVDTYYKKNPKFVYYLSAEYLPGRQMSQNLLYTETDRLARRAFSIFDVEIDDLIALDIEPGLGNGGLGRLAACFMDSLATLDIPSVGYGIRYEYGIFRQSFEDGWQVETPDEWLYYGYPWDFAQPDDMVEVRFGGRTESYIDDHGRYRVRWLSDQRVFGEPYHTMIPGYNTGTVNMLRLWRARASKEFDFTLFDVGDYARAVEQKTYSENISKVLYPNDNTPQGRELRLRQQYFFVACSLHDIIRRYRLRNKGWESFPDKVAIQLNDTHPVVAIPELMRILVDNNSLSWKQAWEITTKTFASTQHTLLPEALEKWPVELFGRLLPRHLEIIYEINHRFLREVRMRYPDDQDRLARMSIIEEGSQKQIRMANLACVGSFSVNGVAELQTQLLKQRVLRDFYEFWPQKFNNKTNGVSPRRFIRISNPRLSALISSKIGDKWLTDLEELVKLEAYVEDENFRRAWREVKHQNKQALADTILGQNGLNVRPEAMFDIMVKRLHEYKRQLLKALHIITLYNRLKAGADADFVPRVFVFGAKAAPGYQMAKLIIKLINSVAYIVNNDPEVGDLLKVVFLENFNVSLAERIYPAADLSEQISTAGKEASGTGNMKFALNGALTVGTLDGANIEIRERVGPENFFLFGHTAQEVISIKENGYDPQAFYRANAELKLAIDRIDAGYFSNGNPELFQPIVDSLLYHDEYLLLADYPSFIASQDQASEVYQNQEQWTRMSILNTARCGYFSSDRAIRQYCQDIWNVKPVRVRAK